MSRSQHTHAKVAILSILRLREFVVPLRVPSLHKNLGRFLEFDFRTKCSDIANNRFGISGETVREGGNLRIYYVQSHYLVSGGSNIWVRYVIPHSSPTRGCWSQQQF